MKKILLLISTILFITSCTPNQFFLNADRPELLRISGLKIGDLDSINVNTTNSFYIYAGGRADLRCYNPGVTQLSTDFTTELLNGKGLRFSFRTVTDKFEQHPSISFDYTTNGCIVKENGAIISQVDSIKAEINKPARIIIENYGKLYNIIVDCDTVYYGKTEIPATEYCIIQTIEKTNAKLSGIEFNDLSGYSVDNEDN